MAIGLAVALTISIDVLLMFATETSSGSVPECRTETLSDGWTSIFCDGRNREKDIAELLLRLPAIANTSRLTLILNAFPTQNARVFARYNGGTHLRIQSDDLQRLLNEKPDFSQIKHLNLSSNHIQDLFDLTRFDRLEELDLSNNSLRRVDFRLLPTTIETINLQSNDIEMNSNVTLPKTLKHLDLSNNHMKFVRPLLSEGLVRLNLSGNNVTDLSFVLSLITTEELDLSRNDIEEIEDDTFSTLSSLIHLDLSRNFIKSLKEKSFSGLNRLQIIDLSRNLLRSITPGTFQYLSNLLWVNLSDNSDMGKLDEIEDSSMLLGAGQKLQTVDASRTNLIKVPNTLTRSIRNLYLSSNRISTIRCGDFDSFLLLQFLDLTSNNISIVEDDAFGRLELLYYLLLAENSLSAVPHSLPDNLLVLDLDRNRIQNITINDFLGLTKLTTLRLAWNRITIVQDGAFRQTTSLQNLDLSGNPIKLLSSSTFVGPRSLIQLDLTSLVNILPTNDTLSFPVPESGHLQILNLENSPALVVQLMNDVAALSMFRHMNVLNLAFTNTQNLRSDLVNFFPRLEVLDLRGNQFDCSNITWLSDWLSRLREQTSQDTKLQLLENVPSFENHTEFDVTLDINTYISRMKTTSISADDIPKCVSPDHLYGVSLYELKSPAFTTAEVTTLQVPRYDRIHFNIRQPHDHEFYQNDFPLPVNDQTMRQNLTSTTQGTKGHVKRSNTTETKSLRTVSTQIIKQNSNRSARNQTKLANIVKMFKDYTRTGQDNVKAEYLRADKVETNESRTNDKLENNRTDTVLIKVKDNKSSRENNDAISILSPLGVNLHEIDSDTPKLDSYLGEDDTFSVSSPQKISINDETDFSKDIPDDEDEDTNDERYTHHPGLLVFFIAAGILGVTALVMRASQRRQSRLGYAQQQDIEVRSLDLSAQELW